MGGHVSTENGFVRLVLIDCELGLEMTIAEVG